MSLQSKTKIYDVYRMHHADGTFMCYVNEKRANWYVKRDLAKWTSPHEFQLKFEPEGKGKAHIDYYNQKLENKCVCCGTPEEEGGLTRHHVVPYVFRSRLPTSYKESNHFDILPLCIDCHEEYEGYATDFKNELLERYNAKIMPTTAPEKIYNDKIKLAKMILNKEKTGLLKTKKGETGALPDSRRQELEELAQKPLLPEPLENSNYVDGWSVITQNVMNNDGLFDFVKSWRQHFIEFAKPQHLPNYWVVDHPLETSEKARTPRIGYKK